MNDSYASEKFQLAVFGLATGLSPIQIRLADAYTDHLMHVGLDDVPEQYREDFTKLMAELKAIAFLPRTGSPESQKGTIGDEDARSLAKRVVDMCFLIQAVPDDELN